MKDIYSTITLYILRRFDPRILGAMLFVIILFSIFSTMVQAEAMSSGSYKMESDSMNFEGSRSTSALYGMEDTSGEIGTGYSQSANVNLHAGFQQATIVAPTPTPTTTPGTSDSSSSGGSSLINVLNVLNFAATPKNRSIILSWEYPLIHNIASVRIIRSEQFFPTGVDDGSVIFDGNISGDIKNLIDNDVVVGKNYYYTIFSRNFVGRFSSGVIAWAKILPESIEQPVFIPSDIFEDIPMVPVSEIDKRILALTLKDFDFIQDGILISHAGTTVVIDGKKNLTVRLDYNKVPQILKTIAMSLTDPEDSSRVFTFLLRANSDETAYEATIAPLGRSGQYKLSAIVLDYENKGLKKLSGMLRALAFDASTGAKISTRQWGYILIILAILIAALLVYRKREEDRNNKLKGSLPQGPLPTTPQA